MINRLYSTIKSNVGSNIQDTSSAMGTIIGRLVNDVYFDILRRINWERLNEDYSFTLTDQDQVLPEDFGKEITVWDATNLSEIERTNIQVEVKDYVPTIDTS
jgi:hypothetical protein